MQKWESDFIVETGLEIYEYFKFGQLYITISSEAEIEQKVNEYNHM